MNFLTYISTAIFASILFTFTLLFLKVFKFITWNPIGWYKELKFFPMSHVVFKWSLLAVIIFIVVMILLKLFSFTIKIHPIFTSIIIGIILWGLVEWAIEKDFSFIKKNSIPFLAMLILFCRALVETSVFHQLAFHSGNRNKLPSQTDVIK
jgi:hypothetical protein